MDGLLRRQGPLPSPFVRATAQRSCLVGRNKISLTSTSSGWLMAKSTILAKESAGTATLLYTITLRGMEMLREV
jgi:hypothetical protein